PLYSEINRVSFFSGIILDFEKGGQLRTKSIDLLDLTPECDVNEVLLEIRRVEPLITVSREEQVKFLIKKLQDKLSQPDDHKFDLFKTLQAHILPLTNVAFNKSGSSFITGSYDRTCKIWDTASGTELHTLEGHKNVVYAVAFNNPYGDKIATGSFDKTCRLWSAETGQCFYTFRGHTAEIVRNSTFTLCCDYNKHFSAKLWQRFPYLSLSQGHSAEIISLSFNTVGSRLVTGSFDHTVSVWDVPSGRLVHNLKGHRGEISSVNFNWDSSLIVTASMDKTCKVWDAEGGRCLATLTGHNDEVLDVCFNFKGQLIATASADGTSRVYDAQTFQFVCKLEGHEGEISKVCFNPQGTCVLTGSADKTARVWSVSSGSCLQVLEGHTDEIFSCAFNYYGDTIITGNYTHMHAHTVQSWRKRK
uniref:Dynein assembly factor with WDR repeat domains 1 n=1 Tax=Astyanax mexicanus TaxID=7994 RepID=A0A8B9L248_ASTMX